MEPLHTFRLALPDSRRVEVVVLEDEAGNLLVRGAHELTPPAKSGAGEAPAKQGGV